MVEPQALVFRQRCVQASIRVEEVISQAAFVCKHSEWDDTRSPPPTHHFTSRLLLFMISDSEPLAKYVLRCFMGTEK